MNRFVALSGLLVAVAGCASANLGEAVAERAEPVEGEAVETLLVLDSRFPGPVTVWVVRGVHRVRLGTVAFGRALRLTVPGEFIGHGRVVRLVARPVGGGGQVTTEEFDVDVGDRIMWTVIEPLRNSGSTLRITVGGP